MVVVPHPHRLWHMSILAVDQQPSLHDTSAMILGPFVAPKSLSKKHYQARLVAKLPGHHHVGLL